MTVSPGFMSKSRGSHSTPPGLGMIFPGMAKIVLRDIQLTANRMATMPPITLRPDTEMMERIKVTGRSDVVDTPIPANRRFSR